MTGSHDPRGIFLVIVHKHHSSTSLPQLLKFSELTTSKLSGDNFLLKEELDSTRALLVDSKKTIASMETQLQMRDVGQEGTANSKAPAAQPKVMLLLQCFR